MPSLYVLQVASLSQLPSVLDLCFFFLLPRLLFCADTIAHIRGAVRLLYPKRASDSAPSPRLWFSFRTLSSTQKGAQCAWQTERQTSLWGRMAGRLTGPFCRWPPPVTILQLLQGETAGAQSATITWQFPDCKTLSSCGESLPILLHVSFHFVDCTGSDEVLAFCWFWLFFSMFRCCFTAFSASGLSFSFSISSWLVCVFPVVAQTVLAFFTVKTRLHTCVTRMAEWLTRMLRAKGPWKQEMEKTVCRWLPSTTILHCHRARLQAHKVPL